MDRERRKGVGGTRKRDSKEEFLREYWQFTNSNTYLSGRRKTSWCARVSLSVWLCMYMMYKLLLLARRLCLW